MLTTIVFDLFNVLYPYSQEAELLVADLRNQGFRLLALSSLAPIRVNEIIVKYGLGAGLCAQDTPYSKKDPELYRYFLDRFNLKAEECLIIDDDQDCLQAAHQAGFKTCWLKLNSNNKNSQIDWQINNLNELRQIIDFIKSK